MKPYRFLPEADAEYEEHVLYFDAQVGGLGDRFAATVEAAVEAGLDTGGSASKI